MSQLILIVEDEQELLFTLDYSLRKAGFRTRCAPDGATAIKLVSQKPLPDLVLLDLMLPDMDGKEICRRIRGFPITSRLPVMMLTACGEVSDRLDGFGSGADDYVIKPFVMGELLFRINAILRRTSAPVEPQNSTVTFGILRVDPAEHRAWVHGEDAGLTLLEFRLLNYLIERRNMVQSRDILLKDVWGEAAGGVQIRTVDVHVNRLREKLGRAGVMIETQRGVGYSFRPAAL